MPKIFVTVLSVFISVVTIAQDIEYADFSLVKSPEYIDTLEYGEENTIVLEQRYALEYAAGEEGLNAYTLIHKRVRIITDKGVEQNNKVYISVNEGDVLAAYDARVIKSDGKTIPLGKDAVKEGEDEESGRTFKYFAFDGIEKGSDIEFFYLVKRQARSSYTGRVMFVQDYTDSYNVSYEVITPSFLIFKFKTYNGLPEMEDDETLDNKNHYALTLNKVEGFESQESAFKEPNMKYFVYKLDRNLSSNAKDIISYGPASANIYANLTTIEKKESKVVAKINKSIKLEGEDQETNIRTIENYIKTNYKFQDINYAQLEDIEFIYENKVYNSAGSMKLMLALFDKNEIDYEIVLTCDRTGVPFDQEFEAYNFLSEYLIYFPSCKKYMSSSSPFNRLGLVGYEFMNTYGLFIKPKQIGDMKTAIGKIKWIEPLTSEMTRDNIFVNVDFDEDFDEPEYEIRKESTGYYAYLQPFYDEVKEEEDREKLSKASIESIDQEGEIEDLAIENEGANNYGVKPFVVTATLKSEKFLEIAGNKYLFKLGELIGPQMELYQEEERMLPVQSEFNRYYHREIVFNIPDNYKAVNLEDIVIDQKLSDDGKEEMVFVSSYTVKDGKVYVVVDEYYNVLDLPKEQFSDYQRVINAAADFNKIVIIFEPK